MGLFDELKPYAVRDVAPTSGGSTTVMGIDMPSFGNPGTPWTTKEGPEHWEAWKGLEVSCEPMRRFGIVGRKVVPAEEED
ncbi:MAG: hypothetical protein Q8Q52_05795 [Acidimicrobiia bacterium]|nr:hypothetical protein [Acidimicrobiia bacterium]